MLVWSLLWGPSCLPCLPPMTVQTIAAPHSSPSRWSPMRRLNRLRPDLRDPRERPGRGRAGRGRLHLRYPNLDRRNRWRVCKSDHINSSSSSRASRSKAWISRRSAIASRVNRPCLRAFRLARGAPEPAAPPCMRQRFRPRMTGARQGLPLRVLAPQRGLACIGPICLMRSLTMPGLPSAQPGKWLPAWPGGAAAHAALPSPASSPTRSRSGSASRCRRWPCRHQPPLRSAR